MRIEGKRVWTLVLFRHPCDLIVHSSALFSFFNHPFPCGRFFFSLFKRNNGSKREGTGNTVRFRCESTGGNPVCFGVVTVNREQHRKGFPSNDLFSDYTIPRNRFEGIHIRYLCEQTRPKRIHYREDGILWLIVRLVNPV